MKIYQRLFQNHRGSVLQIVLIVFMMLTLALSITAFSILQSGRNLKSIDMLMKQKYLEIFLVKYYSDSVQNDILLSDDYFFQNYQVETTVDDFGHYYEVITTITMVDYHYQFLTEIEVETGAVLKFEYIGGSI